jgi:4-amino-4-deoxy-L-arabinose transferase-like glycosyltransferase
MADIHPHKRRINIVVLAIVLAIGVFLRIPSETFAPNGALHSIAALHPQTAFTQTGFDEGLYQEYVNKLGRFGVSSYPLIVQDFVERQERIKRSILSPLRFLYIFSGYAWRSIFGCDALQALHNVAALFSMLTLGLATLFAWRLRGPLWALGVAALMAVAPTQIHMSQHAMVDGFFTFWALLSLWLLWENFQKPRNWTWLVAYILGLCLLLLTKENAFFVWIAIVALLICNRWLNFGQVTRELWLATLLGPLVGVVILTLLAGGIGEVIHTYRYSVAKNYELQYAILTGDGPWHRYIVDLLLVSPVVVLLALGSIFRLDRTKKPELYLTIFICGSFVVMCNVKYGMNLRYGNMWDMPLRFLALSMLVTLTTPLRRYRSTVLVIAVCLICVLELRQYIILAVRYPLYELIPMDLLRALRILKFP